MGCYHFETGMVDGKWDKHGILHLVSPWSPSSISHRFVQPIVGQACGITLATQFPTPATATSAFLQRVPHKQASLLPSPFASRT
eukprot:c25065_g3_i2 orf=422-673(+)